VGKHYSSTVQTVYVLHCQIIFKGSRDELKIEWGEKITAEIYILNFIPAA